MDKVIVITGPTAVGKTKLSVEIAKKTNGEIINADSTQVFKMLNIATAKVTEDEMEGVVHHLIDIKNIDEDYTVYDYQKDCRLIIEDIKSRGKTPILVGGTGLYIKAALYDYDFDDNGIIDDFSELSNDEVYDKLLDLDSGTTIHKNNRKRVVRALNYCINENKKYSDKEIASKLLYDTVFIGLTTERDNLYKRINARVESMINDGLLNEAKLIYNTNIRTKAVMTPIGYKELFDYFDNKLSLEEATELIKQRSRKYAKRQYTWFNNQMNIKWFETNYDDFDLTINEVLKYLK